MFVDNNNDEYHINILQNGLGNDGDGQGDRSDLQKRQTTGKMTLALGFLTISNDLHFSLSFCEIIVGHPGEETINTLTMENQDR